MSQDELYNLVEPLIKEAYLLEPCESHEAEKATVNSKFGGHPYAQANDSWPQCPSCTNELTFVAQLKDEKSGNLFVFYYCFECFPWGLDDEEKGQWVVRRYQKPSMEQYREISAAKENEATVVPCTVSTKIVKVLPDWQELNAYSKKANDLCCEVDNDEPWEVYDAVLLQHGCINDYAILFGGYPRWVQSEATKECPECGEKLAFLAQIDSEDAADLMWGDVGLVYLFQCKNHPDVFHLELQCY